MPKPRPEPFDKHKVVAENRRARYDYFIEDRFEAGIVLAGNRGQGASPGRGLDRGKLCGAGRRGGVADQQPYPRIQPRQPDEPRAEAKAQAAPEAKREIGKLHGAVNRQGLTLVPLSIYFNARGKAKVELALARGKKAHDKRETIKERDWKREQQRLLRQDV
jgi:SsrA-binding protein